MSKIAFLFPGGGVQYVGMMQDIVQENPAAAEIYDQSERISGMEISKLTFEGPKEALDLSENTQPCMLAAEAAALAAVQSAGIRADAYLGFSQGEWTALLAAGVITYEDAMRLIVLRGACMQRATPEGGGGMAVILGKTAEEVQALCARVEGYVEPSNYNCPGQISVAGEKKAIQNLLAIADEEGIAAQQIIVSIPSHCKLMKPAADEMQAAVEQLEFRNPDRPIVMNCCAEAVTDAVMIKKNIIEQLTNPVYMEDSLGLLLDQGFDIFIEIGPGKTLTKMLNKCAKAKGVKVQTLAVRDSATLKQTVDQLGVK